METLESYPVSQGKCFSSNILEQVILSTRPWKDPGRAPWSLWLWMTGCLGHIPLLAGTGTQMSENALFRTHTMICIINCGRDPLGVSLPNTPHLFLSYLVSHSLTRQSGNVTGVFQACCMTLLRIQKFCYNALSDLAGLKGKFWKLSLLSVKQSINIAVFELCMYFTEKLPWRRMLWLCHVQVLNGWELCIQSHSHHLLIVPVWGHYWVDPRKW